MSHGGEKTIEFDLAIQPLLDARVDTATYAFNSDRRTREPDRPKYIRPNSWHDGRAGLSHQVFTEGRLIDAEGEPEAHRQIEAAHQIAIRIDRMTKHVRRDDGRPNRGDFRDNNIPWTDAPTTREPW